MSILPSPFHGSYFLSPRLSNFARTRNICYRKQPTKCSTLNISFIPLIQSIRHKSRKVWSIKAGSHATICRPDLSARQCRSANRTCILTPDLRPIRENENRPDSENLLQCNRFLCSRADTFKEADMSIKILSREHAYKSEAIKMADKKTPKRPKSRSFQEEEISLLISEWFKYPCLFDKGSKDYHDKNKREIARTLQFDANFSPKHIVFFFFVSFCFLIMLQQVTAMTLLLLLMMNKAPINCDSQPFFS